MTSTSRLRPCVPSRRRAASDNQAIRAVRRWRRGGPCPWDRFRESTRSRAAPGDAARPSREVGAGRGPGGQARQGAVPVRAQSDVTQQHVDLEARLKNLQAEEVRLRRFLDKATKVSEMLVIQRELSRVRGEIESMQAQIAYLDRQTAMATLSLALSAPGALVQPTGGTWGFSAADHQRVPGCGSRDPHPHRADHRPVPGPAARRLRGARLALAQAAQARGTAKLADESPRTPLPIRSATRPSNRPSRKTPSCFQDLVFGCRSGRFPSSSCAVCGALADPRQLAPEMPMDLVLLVMIVVVMVAVWRLRAIPPRRPDEAGIDERGASRDEAESPTDDPVCEILLGYPLALYGLPSAAGATARPTTPASTMTVST